MLELSELSTYYGPIRALERVDLKINEGEIVCLIGANGAGKTTLLKTVSGLLRPERGKVLFEGKPIGRLSAESIVRLGLSLVPERRQVFGTMTVYDNLLLGAYHRRDGLVRRDIDRMYDIFPILRTRQKQAAGKLSGGEQQMLVIARGLMAKPRLLMLDEPSVGLAPLLVREILRIVAELCAAGTTILLVEQNVKAALQIAHRGYVLENGRIVSSGPARVLMADARVQRAYLGRLGVVNRERTENMVS